MPARGLAVALLWCIKERPMWSDAREQQDRGTNRDEARRALEQALVDLSRDSKQLGAVERLVADYCKGRHRDGVDASEVLVELKRIAQPILGESGKFERLVSNCIRHYYGDVEKRPER
jgi:hypothetical protein